MTKEEHLAEIREYARQHTMLKVPGESPTMKTTAHSPQPTANEPLRLFVILSLLVSILFLGSGCGTVAAIKRPFITTTNAVPVVVTVPGSTNVIERIVPAETNVTHQADGSALVTIRPAFTTNLVTITAPSSVTNWVTNVSTVVNPALAGALATAETVNSFNPTPSAPIINFVLYTIMGILGYVAKVKTKQANENAGLARTLILGIEEAKSEETKAAVAKVSAAAGNAPQVNALVQRITRAF